LKAGYILFFIFCLFFAFALLPQLVQASPFGATPSSTPTTTQTPTPTPTSTPTPTLTPTPTQAATATTFVLSAVDRLIVGIIIITALIVIGVALIRRARKRSIFILPPKQGLQLTAFKIVQSDAVVAQFERSASFV